MYILHIYIQNIKQFKDKCEKRVFLFILVIAKKKILHSFNINTFETAYSEELNMLK